MSLFFKIIFLINFLNIFCETIDELVFVFQMFRHGERGSIYEESLQGNIESYYDRWGVKWKGNAVLLQKGIDRSIRLGLKSRKKYNLLFNNETIITKNNLKIFSTDFQRTIKSAEYYLQGFNKSISNTSSFIEIIEQDEFDQLFLTKKNCKNHDIIIDTNYKESKSIQKLLNHAEKKYADKLKIIFNKSNNSFIRNLNDIFFITDSFLCNYVSGRNFSFPFKKYNINPKDFYKFSLKYQSNAIILGETNKNLSKITTSKTFPKIFKYMDDAIEKYNKGENDYLKMVIFSSHDSFIAQFEVFMKNIYKTKLIYPYFSDYISFELYKRNDNFILKFYFKEQEFYTGDYNSMKNEILSQLWNKTEMDDFCGNYEILEQESLKNKIIRYFNEFKINIVISIGFILILICCCYFCCRKGSKKKQNNSENETELTEIYGKME